MKWTILTAIVLGLLASAAPAGAGALPADVIKKITEAAPDKPTAAPKAKRRLLVFNLCRGFRHSSIPYAAKAVEVLGQKTGAYETVVTDDLSIFQADKLKAFDAICFNNTTGRLFGREGEGKVLKDNVWKFLRGGKGAVGIHAATDGECGEFFGAHFAGHPWGRIPVKLDEPEHPLTRAFGGKGFEIADEIYTFKAPYSRASLRVLLSVDMAKFKLPPGRKGPRDDNDYAVSWVRPVGKGRAFYCSLGHRHEILWNPTLLRHYLDGIQFALGDLPAEAAPREPAAPDKDAWVHLFDGKDLSAWRMRPGSWAIEDGAMARKGGGDAWTNQRFGDFVLDLEFRVAKGTNSGIFIRTGNVRDSVQTGLEIQVLDSAGKDKVGKHDCGALYDCVAPVVNAARPPGEWNRIVITCRGAKVQVVLNDQQIIDADLDEWTEPRKNPDGSGNKFRTALKDFPREGHIGFQDHGGAVWYRNVKIRPLKD